MSTHAPPSTFAALLRRSKFASYDPRIGQVYETFGGHSHRGDWGVKRPLATRQRNGRVTLQAIDTRYQQTEWRPAYHPSRWMTRWNEMACKVVLDDHSPWGQKMGAAESQKWHIDTDFAQRSGSSERDGNWDMTMTFPVPNFAAMNQRQFDRFVKRLHPLRPKFREFLRKEAGNQATADSSRVGYPVAPQPVDLYQRAQFDHKAHLSFITEETKEKAFLETSTTIIQLPHPSAGLSYTHAPVIQNQILSKPLPGRLVEHMNPRPRFTTALAAVGGFIGDIPKNRSDGINMTDFGDRNLAGTPRSKLDDGKGIFKATEVKLVRAPTTVGRNPQGLKQTKLKISFNGWKTAATMRSNPHEPGSRDYVGSFEQSLEEKGQMMTRKRPIVAGQPSSAADNNRSVLYWLDKALRIKDVPPSDGEL